MVKPITGLDLLKLLHEMSSKEGNRNWADGGGSAIGITVLLGLPLLNKAFRQEFFELLRKGVPTHHFHEKLQLFKTLQGEPCRPTLIIHELIRQNLISESTDRYVLTKEGLQRIKQEESKTLSSQTAPVLSKIETHGKTDVN
jgi:hypothetical protein